MKRLLLAPFLLLILASCQSRQDICADWDGGKYTYQEASKILGVVEPNRIRYFCEYYKGGS